MSATWFDHAIATVAPRMAARRVMARQAFETLTRGYDGAARGRRTEGWRAPGSSADTEIGVAGALLRDRMRDLVRNNPHAAKAVAVLVNNIIGAGIMPRAASGDDTLDRKVDALFDRWTAECDADGQLDFYGLQTLICREMVEAGEVLVRRRLRRASDGLPVPLQLQVLEADFLDATKSGALGAGRFVQGIEFDPVGKRRAYWLHAEHPGDAYGALQNGLQSRPVPATEIAHVYEKQRTQARGVPWGAPVIRSLRDLDDYEVAELVRKKTEACVTAIVFGDDEAQQGIAPSVVDADGNRVEQFEPGLIAYARGGKDIRFNQPSATGGYGEYKRASLHTISAGFRVPYELLTGDLSQVNYSSIRAGLVEFRRQIDAVQWQLFIPMFCAPVWRWFTEAAWAAGQIPSPTVSVEWSPPKFEAVDPQKDAMANLLSIRSGTMTLAEVIAKQGRKLAQSLGTTVASIQTLERAGELAGVSMSGIEQATKDLTRRLSQAAAGTGPAADALDRLGLSATDLIALPLDQRVGAINAAIENFVPAAERAAVAGQLFGEEGSIAMSRIDTATLRQATEDVLAFGVVVSEQDADQIERTNDAISRLGLIWRGLSNQLAVAAAPALEAVADAMAAVASRTGPLGIAIRGLFDNIGRLTTYAATFAAFLAGRWVVGMAAAALSVRGLATALVVLRDALIRTGIGALIVGAGELVYQFTRLVSGAGGFGEAMSLLKDLAVEVWERIRMGAAAAGAAATAMFFDLKADAASGMQSAIESVVAFGNTAANTFEGAYEAIKAIWGLLPAAIGDLAFQAANSLVDGVEAMLNGVVSRINGFIGGINQGLEALGSERRISLVPDLDLGEIENRFEGAASAATTAAQAAFDRAFEDNPLTAPDLGLTEAANRALESANLYRGAARDLAEGARAPLESWQALRDAVRSTDETSADALTEATGAAERLETALGEAGRAATGAGAAAGASAAAAEPATEAAVTGWQAVTAALSDYASKAREIGGDIGQSLVGAFQSAENAVGEFVKTGKLNFRDLVTSLLADLAQLAARRFILGPIANALSGVFSGAGGIFANVLHAGGMVGSVGPSRLVPAMAFAAAPRMHSGGMAGLRHDEVPAILQRGERVLSRREAQSYGTGGGVNVTIMARDAVSFRQSRTQVAADIARAVSLGRRGM